MEPEKAGDEPAPVRMKCVTVLDCMPGHADHENGPPMAMLTRTALSSTNERLRIEVLTLLDGVSWPTASVLLHFGHPDPYPILDFRALWSLGVHVPEYAYTFYDFGIWWPYTQFCRGLAAECKVSMRVLDRALWQYSKENQKNVTEPDAEAIA